MTRSGTIRLGKSIRQNNTRKPIPLNGKIQHRQYIDKLNKHTLRTRNLPNNATRRKIAQKTTTNRNQTRMPTITLFIVNRNVSDLEGHT